MARYLVPARLFLPGRGAGLVFKATPGNRLLRHRHDQRVGLVQILAEALAEGVLRQPEEAILVGADTGSTGGWITPRKNAAEAVALIRREGRDIDEANDIGCMAGAADHRAAIGVADKQGRAIKRFRQFARALDVVGKRGQWVLHCSDPVALGVEWRDHVTPMGSIAPGAVYEQDVLDGRHCPFLSHSEKMWSARRRVRVSRREMGGRPLVTDAIKGLRVRSDCECKLGRGTGRFHGARH
ncbi:hypothetical protein D9M72_437730 [compost metagenome]